VHASRKTAEDSLLASQMPGCGSRLFVDDGDVAAGERPVEEFMELVRTPEARASRMISSAILTFLLPPGLKYSSLTSSRPLRPRGSTRRPSSTKGVLPIAPRTEFARDG